MPEGPVIVLMKDALDKFVGQKVISTTGTVQYDHSLIVHHKLKEIKLYGKQTFLIFDQAAIRIHLLMFGSYEMDEQTKPEKNLRIGLTFKNGKALFYTCSVKILPLEKLDEIDWSADVMSEDWNSKNAKNKLKQNPEMLICDALMDQDIFAGVGNIIKNEALFLAGVQPESKVGKIPAKQMNAIIKEARDYSFDFLKWKMKDELSRHWRAYQQKTCPKCGEKLMKKSTGKTKRTSFYCPKDQKLYG